jgi:hypothetical protein
MTIGATLYIHGIRENVRFEREGAYDEFVRAVRHESMGLRSVRRWTDSEHAPPLQVRPVSVDAVWRFHG